MASTAASYDEPDAHDSNFSEGLFHTDHETKNQPPAEEGEVGGGRRLSPTLTPRAKHYIYEMREHPDTAAPGPWPQAKIATRSSASINGLVPGKRYAFRIRATEETPAEDAPAD